MPTLISHLSQVIVLALALLYEIPELRRQQLRSHAACFYQMNGPDLMESRLVVTCASSRALGQQLRSHAVRRML